MLSYTLWHALTFPVTYLLVFILVASALLQIRYLNRALQRFDSTQVIPTQFVLFTLSVIIGSAVLYRDFESATIDRVAKFVGGCILTFLGVYLITSARGSKSDGGDGDSFDEENAIGLVDEERYQDEIEERHTAKDRMFRHESTTSIRFSDPPKSRSPRRDSRRPSDGPSSAVRTPHRSPSSASDLPLRQDPSSPSALLENPWQSSRGSPTRPTPHNTTYSTPLLPTEAQINDPLTPDTTRRQPGSPRKSDLDRPPTLTRASMARMMPGPLVSPLSSPLSAIVADSLRRGVDLSPTGKRRPGLSALRKSRSQRSAAVEDPTPSEGSPLRREPQRPGMATTATDSPKGRSFSVSLGEFFRMNRGKSPSGDTDQERSSQREGEDGHSCIQPGHIYFFGGLGCLSILGVWSLLDLAVLYRGTLIWISSALGSWNALPKRFNSNTGREARNGKTNYVPRSRQGRLYPASMVSQRSTNAGYIREHNDVYRDNENARHMYDFWFMLWLLLGCLPTLAGYPKKPRGFLLIRGYRIAFMFF